MNIPLRLSLALAAAGLISATAAGIQSSTQPPDDPIAALDCAIHERFLDRRTFGFGRILPNRFHGVRQFQPENAFEQRVVSELVSKGYQVTLFLVGRWALQAPPDMIDVNRLGLQGPAFITHADTSYPDAAKLLALGRQALQNFSHSEGYEVREGEWTAAVRPLRATKQTCVNCHAGQGVKIGDALGTAIYVYRKL